MNEPSKSAGDRRTPAKKTPAPKKIPYVPPVTWEKDGRIIFRDQEVLDAYVREATVEQVKKRLLEVAAPLVQSARDWWNNRNTTQPR